MEHQLRASQKGMSVFESRGFATPHHSETVEKLKGIAAVLWTELDAIVPPPGNSETGRYLAIAKTELESSVMFAVKALSRFSPSTLL